MKWRHFFLAASGTEVGVKLVQFHFFVVRQCVLVDKAVFWQSGNWVASRTYSCASCSAKQKVWLILMERWDEHLAQYFRAIEAILDRKLASEKRKEWNIFSGWEKFWKRSFLTYCVTTERHFPGTLTEVDFLEWWQEEQHWRFSFHIPAPPEQISFSVCRKPVSPVLQEAVGV